jgi:DNA (cytosine-5)-methyltransferase 1
LNSKLKVLDLFSGIGGFSLGLHSTGIFDTVKFVEIDKFCQKVLNKNFPGIPIEEDIKNVKGQEFEADVITGGFPCQPFSVAGKQKGTNDNRYLWPEMLRLIKEIKPEFVIGENVQGLINLQNGMVLRQVQDDLEGEGFEVQCFLIPASGLGAWHKRNRVWIVGHSKYNGLLAAEKRSRDKKINGGTQKGQNETIESERTSGSKNDEDVSNTTGSRSSSESVRNIRSLGEKSETKERREGDQSSICTSSCSSEGREAKENVSNSTSLGPRECRDSDQEEGREGCSSTQSDGKRSNVSNTIGQRATISTKGRHSSIEVFGSHGKKRRDNVSNTISKLSDGCSGTTRDSKTEFIRLECNEGWHWNQVRSETKRCSEQSKSTNQTWWQIESNLCRVPDGISYGLDKGRVNRIKSLGNAIVPQCARIIGLAIKKVLIEEGRE